jgi:hypothetical protein
MTLEYGYARGDWSMWIEYGEISLAAPKQLASGGRHADTSTAIKSQRDQGAVGGGGVEDDPRSLAQPPQRQTVSSKG